MPNWCEGTLKVRGKFKNLVNFIKHGLKPVTFLGDDCESLNINESDTYIWIDNIKHDLYLEGTRRHFCEPSYISLDVDDPEEYAILLLPMRAAWSIDADSLQELCKEFHVDMKIQGFEQGMQFSQIIEIINGEIIQDKEIKYDDWDWDCPCPTMGG